MAMPQRNNMVPLTALTGQTTDVSAALCFTFWEPVYYKVDENSFPSTSKEEIGQFVGISENCGHAMTFKILKMDTLKVIICSNIHRADDDMSKNWRVAPLDGESKPPIIIKSKGDIETLDETDKPEVKKCSKPVFDPHEIIGKTFLKPTDNNGERMRATVIKCIEDHDKELAKDPDRKKFICSLNNDQYEEIMSYNEIMDHINDQDQENIVWKFRRIVAHQGPLHPHSKDYKGSRWNVSVEWENGEITWELLSTLAKDDPVTCTIYAEEHNLLEEDGWKKLRHIAKRQKKLLRMVKQAKLRSYRTAPKYKFGYQVPRDYKEAIALDTKFGNSRWQDAVDLELEMILAYKTFKNIGYKALVPNGYKKIRVHLVFDVKHDG